MTSGFNRHHNCTLNLMPPALSICGRGTILSMYSARIKLVVLSNIIYGNIKSIGTSVRKLKATYYSVIIDHGSSRSLEKVYSKYKKYTDDKLIYPRLAAET
jgi:hypothetical protein